MNAPDGFDWDDAGAGAPALPDSAALARAQFDDSPIATVITDADGVIRHVNAAFGALFGYSPRDIPGRSALGITHSDDRAATRVVRACLKLSREQGFGLPSS